MKSLGVFHSTYYNKNQFKFAFENFRIHFPEVPYLIYSDMGDDFSEYVNKNTFYKKASIRYYGTGPKSIWLDNWDLWLSYYQRLKDSCEICNTDYILIMEDDVLINKKFEINEDFNFCGPCKSRLSDFILNFLETKNIKVSNPFYGLCGGSIFNAKVFLENYDKIIVNLKKFHYEYSNNLNESIAISPDGNFTIQFNLLGLEYTCSEYMNSGDIIHPYAGYIRYTE